MRPENNGASPVVLGMHAAALALICLSIGGYAGSAAVVAGMTLVAASLLVSRRVGRGTPEVAVSPIQVDFTRAGARDAERAAARA